MQINASRNSGFTLLEIMIVVAIIGLLAGISTPSALRARESGQLNSILSNLRMIENSKDQWALDNKTGAGAQPLDAEIAQYIKGYKNASAIIPVSLGSIGAGGSVTLP